MIEIWIRLKGVKKPIIVVPNSKEDFDKLYENIETHDVIKFAGLIFRRDDISYISLEKDED